MNLKEVEKAVARIQTQLFKNSNSFAVGMFKSHFKGTGLQFKEHQLYVHGDDVRFIDWKLSAKTRNSYIKTFEEERNVEIVVIVDITMSMFTGYKGISKIQAAVELCCLLYLLAESTGDKVKVIIWGEEEVILPSKKGREGIILLVSTLEQREILNENGKVNIGIDINDQVEEKKKIATIKLLLAKNKEVVLLSDFTGFMEVKSLNRLLYRKNIHCFKLQSPLDLYNRVPFSFLGFHSQNKKFENQYISKEASFIDRRGEERIRGRIKDLNVKDRYLEKFIKEMI